MKKIILIALLGLATFTLSAQAQILGISVGRRGVSLGVGAPVYYAPPAVVYSAPPTYYAPQASYYAPPAYYASPVYYGSPAVVYGSPGCYSYGPTVVIGGYGGRYGGYRHYGYGWHGGGWHR
jgi:hypothetical protein